MGRRGRGRAHAFDWLGRYLAAKIASATGPRRARLKFMLPVLISATMPGSKWDIRDSEMKNLTDDPDWARDIYEPRALAMMFCQKAWLA
jgi:hypothetical protein